MIGDMNIKLDEMSKDYEMDINAQLCDTWKHLNPFKKEFTYWKDSVKA